MFYFDPNAGLAKFEGKTIIDDDELEGDKIEDDELEDDENDDDDDDDDETPLEVSGFAMLALLASVGGVLYLALRRGA